MRFRYLTGPLFATLVAALVVAQPGLPIQSAAAYSLNHLAPIQRRLISGFVSSELNRTTSAPVNATRGASASSSALRNYYPGPNGECPVTLGSNTKVNQNCLNLSDSDLQGRAQAQNETAIAINPNDPSQVIASFNDYRRGDGTCGPALSSDGGHTWQDVTTPNGFVRGDAFGTARQYLQASGDTAVAWDTKGNAYLQCQMFDRGPGVTTSADDSSGVYVYRSTLNGGASFNFPGRPVIQNADPSGSQGGAVLEDKPYMTVDDHVGSPYQDRIYVTWTEFAADGTGYIYESYSKNYGESFTSKKLVSRTSSMCGNTYGLPTPRGKCNENQFSDPFTGADGSLYVVWANYNNVVTGNDNRNQILLAKSTDGGQTFGSPIKVSDYYDLPDCLTYQGQDAFRACVPEKGSTSNSFFRATNYPSGAVDPTNSSRIAVTVGSYINVHSNETNGCVPAGLSGSTGLNLYDGVKTPGACNNDILISVSHNAGGTFTGTSTDPRQLATVNQDSGQATTDQYWQWESYTQQGALAVSYYDRQFGNDETNGYSDFSLSGSNDLLSFATSRVTSSSMPPPTQFSGVFLGDYTGLDVSGNTALPLWSDTRDLDLFVCHTSGSSLPNVCTGSASNATVANDQDAFTNVTPIPLP
jgi:hypothetical protein